MRPILAQIGSRAMPPGATSFARRRDNSGERHDRLRCDHHRHRTGGAGPGAAAGGLRPEGRDRRAQSLRRHLRQYRMHADQDDGRERLRHACRAARRRLWLFGRGRGQGRHEAGQGPQGPRRRPEHQRRRTIAQEPQRTAPSTRGMRASWRRTRSRSAARRCGRIASSSNVGGRAAVPPIAGLDSVPYFTNSTMHGRRFPAAASAGAGRQLHRARVRADVSPLRQRGDGRRDRAAPRRARGRGGVPGGDGIPAARRDRRCR